MFVLAFENEFVFQPDTLVVIVQEFLAKTGLSQYTVTVHECDRPDIVYGFEINPPLSSIEACAGRIHPKACYSIEVAFADFPDASIPYAPMGIVVSGILSVFAIALVAWKLGYEKSKSLPLQNASMGNGAEALPTLGRFVFDTVNQRLKLGDERILLTDKEYKVLIALSRNIGQLTSRDELIQEVWTDEGVITGRSLDMFISKLRKKLSADPDLRITNIHGRGYKLEIVDE